MKLQEAIKLLKNSGYLCEFTTAATPTFEEYLEKVKGIVAKKVGEDRAERMVELYDIDLKDLYSRSWTVDQGADAVIEWATPSEKQKEILEFMYNNWNADNERSYGPAAEYDYLKDRTEDAFDYDVSTYIPYDMEEFAVLYGKDINE